jgi:hypothetical protein
MNQVIKLYQYEIKTKSKEFQSYRLSNKLIAEIVLKYKDENEPCLLSFLDMDENSDSFNMIRNDICFYQLNKNYISINSKDKNKKEMTNLNQRNILLGMLTYQDKYFLIGNVVNYGNNQTAFAFFVRK